jgi:hypothetical protein
MTRRADDNTYSLLSNASATGSAVAIRGGRYTFSAEGTAGGATIALQAQTPNGTWSTVKVFSNSAVSTTALPYAQTAIDLPAGSVRASITGGAGVSVSANWVGLG